MGYTTTFEGRIDISPPLNPEEKAYLDKFATTRRMDRDNGPYYIDGSGVMGQGHDPDIYNFNKPPDGQPGLWCQWVPTPDGTALMWDGGEKFYKAEEWMAYIIDHFLKPNAQAEMLAADYDSYFGAFSFNHTLNGKIVAQGEESDDRWTLIVVDNRVSRKEGWAIVLCPECNENTIPENDYICSSCAA